MAGMLLASFESTPWRKGECEAAVVPPSAASYLQQSKENGGIAHRARQEACEESGEGRRGGKSGTTSPGVSSELAYAITPHRDRLP